MEENKQMVPVEVQVIQAKAQADYNMTPAGQMVSQFATLQRMGQMYASATIVPDTYKSNVGNCAIAVDMANRMSINPVMVMQNLYIVHGNPSFSSKFLVSCINASKRFTPLRYEFKGEEGKDDYGCRCYAYEVSDRERKEPLYGDWITWKMVNAEGWNKKPGSKWNTMPNQMFRYRAAAFWQRVYCPEISMGFISAEEAFDEAEIIGEERRVKSEEFGKRKSLAEIAAEAASAPSALQWVPDASEAVPVGQPVVDTETGEVSEEGAVKSEEPTATPARLQKSLL